MPTRLRSRQPSAWSLIGQPQSAWSVSAQLGAFPVFYAGMASHACSISASVLKGDPPTLMADLLTKVGRQVSRAVRIHGRGCKTNAVEVQRPLALKQKSPCLKLGAIGRVSPGRPASDNQDWRLPAVRRRGNDLADSGEALPRPGDQWNYEPGLNRAGVKRRTSLSADFLPIPSRGSGQY